MELSDITSIFDSLPSDHVNHISLYPPTQLYQSITLIGETSKSKVVESYQDYKDLLLSDKIEDLRVYISVHFRFRVNSDNDIPFSYMATMKILFTEPLTREQIYDLISEPGNNDLGLNEDDEDYEIYTKFYNREYIFLNDVNHASLTPIDKPHLFTMESDVQCVFKLTDFKINSKTKSAAKSIVTT